MTTDPETTLDQTSTEPGLLVDATHLLDRELPDPRFVDERYLHWAYRENPLGRAIERHHRVDNATVAHYAVMPRRYRGPDSVTSNGLWSLNAVVHADHQRDRHFTRIGLDIYAEAANQGFSFATAVTNAKSTGVVVKYMGWRLLGPLPVRVMAPLGRGRRNIEHFSADRNFLDSDAFRDLAAIIDRHRVTGWATDYNPEVLRWRLAIPHLTYRIHVAGDCAVITTKSSVGPVPALVVLKVFPLVSGAKVDATRTIRSIIIHERCAFGVYAGFQNSVTVRGMAPPKRLQPSPLNLLVRGMDPDIDQDQLELDTFEFLDMDAY